MKHSRLWVLCIDAATGKYVPGYLKNYRLGGHVKSEHKCDIDAICDALNNW